MFVVKDRIYGLGGETWEDVIASFDTEEEAQIFCNIHYQSYYYIEEEQ